jgi:peptidoglycan hydrolase CwlO-like protein
MEQVESLARLEEAIDKLLTTMQEMKLEKSQLESKLEEKEQETFELKQQLDTLQSERSRIHQRVTGLISSIDKWEMTAEPKAPAKGKATASAQAGLPGEGKTLF